MPNERFEHISKSTRAMYTPGSPVILAAVALLKDNQTGKVLVQAKFKSVSDKAITAVFVDVRCKDVTGTALEGIEGFQYLDLSAGHNAEFGQKTPIYLPNERTRNISVSVCKVMLADSAAWDAPQGEAWEPMPEQQPLYAELGSNLAEQYRRDVGRSTLDGYAPMQYQDLWFCVCGANNRNDVARCPHCGLVKETGFSALDREALTAHRKDYDEQMHLKREADEERAKKQWEADELRLKKQTKLIAIVLASGVGLILILVFTIFVGKQTNYSKAVKLFEQGNYLEAAEKFESLQGYSDSAKMLQKLDWYLPGSIVKYGWVSEYKPLEWIVLTSDGEKSLLITKGITHTHGGYKVQEAPERLLSESDYTFSSTEEKAILETEVSDSKMHLFLLSAEEVEMYFPDKENREPYRIDGYYGTYQWWLRPGEQTGSVYVGRDGEIIFSNTYYGKVGLRPAMWVRIP